MTIATLHTDLRAAWRAELQAITGLGVQWAWEGRKYDPVDGTPFVRESFRAISSDPRAVGRGGNIEHRMTGNLVMVFPAGKGTLLVETAAGLILSAFYPGKSLIYGSNGGVVVRASRSPVAVTPQWVEVPVTVTIVAYTANP